MRHAVSIYLALLAIYGLRASAGEPPAGDSKLLDEARRGTAAAEGKLLDLRVRSSYQIEQRDGATGKWQMMNDADLTSWYQGSDGANCRVDLSKLVSKWVGGPSEYGIERETLAYNGRIGQTLMTQSGSPEHRFAVLDGEIGAKPPKLFSGFCNAASGWSFSLFGVVADYREPFSSFLSNPGIQAERTNVDGHSVIRICFTPDNGNSWLLDPARGYALVGYQTARGGKPVDQCTVTKLQQVAPGVYYPAAVDGVTHDAIGAATSRASFRASQIVANDPHFDSRIFTLKWPVGTRIHDAASNTTFIEGPNGSELKLKTRESAPDVRSKSSTAPPPAE